LEAKAGLTIKKTVTVNDPVDADLLALAVEAELATGDEDDDA
jgi:hypothetical protein